MQTDYDTIVIGSGVGGLTAALCLARSGQRVLVLEQHYLPGGWCHSFSLEGFQFSPGIHYLGALKPGGKLHDIYKNLGIAENITFLEINPNGYDHVCIGNQRFDIPKGREIYIQRLQQRFPQEAQNIKKYFTIVARTLKGLSKKHTVKDLYCLLRHGFGSVERLLDYCKIKAPLLRGILTIQAGNHAMSPSEASVVSHAGLASHYFEGAYYPKGGGKSIIKAYIKALRQHNGKIKTRTAVEKILLKKRFSGWQAQGICTQDGTEITAKNVISNADPHMTFHKLIGQQYLSRKLKKQLQKTVYSTSCISLFLAIDMDVIAAGLDSGNYLYADTTSDIEATYQHAAYGKTLPKEITHFFLTVTTLKDPSKRKDGIHTMEMFSFVPHNSFEKWHNSDPQSRPQEYLAVKQQISQQMKRALEKLIPGISEKIVFESIGTPLTNNHYIPATNYNVYGVKKTVRQIGPFAYSAATEINNLYTCGASNVYHGIMGATISGIVAACGVSNCGIHDILTQTQHDFYDDGPRLLRNLIN
ncbi:phytoene desaturase family protein [Candidatus Uabimicrobium sp. HlEnr_7]|uniref:phytoene desaturase family protein n=1 Tax=Candidatus Uabimicrobium helgolandensis TaxID=3095367 RepID=UPI003556D677